jgi:hypothetical protein
MSSGNSHIVTTVASRRSEALAAVRRLYDTRLHAGLQAAEFFYGKPERLNAPALTVYIVGLERGVPTLGRFGVDVVALRPFRLDAYVGVCPGRMCPDGHLFDGVSVAGEPALKLLRTTPRPPWLAVGDAAAARHLIELQADATPERVGRPIDVLELSRAGVRWIKRDARSACAAIQ